jgi:hypothetical protein
LQHGSLRTFAREPRYELHVLFNMFAVSTAALPPRGAQSWARVLMLALQL